MSRAALAATVIALVVVATVLLNVSLYRRMKARLAEMPAWTDERFDAALAERGVAPEIAPVLRDVLRPHYGAGVAPHPDDNFAKFLQLDEDEVLDMVEEAFVALRLPLPDRGAMVEVPVLKTVADMAQYLDEEVAQRRGTAR